MKLVTVFEKSEIERFLHPCLIVEGWRNGTATGRGRRKFAESFNPNEREVIRKMHKWYYSWCMGVGIPAKHAMPIKTFEIMTKAAKYFGEY